MSEPRPVAVGELRGIITDPSELVKGTEISDRGGLAHLARHGAKLFADAAGSGASPYKAQIVFADDKVTGRCSCMAARSRPFCKHAAALLVTWARTPEAFAVAELPPVAEPGPRKRAAVKGGKVDVAELRRRGVDQASTVLLELWQTGLRALAADRAGQVADLAEKLREMGLRRLSARTLELAGLLSQAARRDGSVQAPAYAGLVADMWLTVRKLEKHLDGEPLADEHVEELIGRTWTKKDRKPVAGLDLVEYAFRDTTTVDGFALRESRLFDLATGDHFSEKQILPAMIAKRAAPKPSYAGLRLSGASGSLFPSFPPRRLDLEETGARSDLDAAALELAAERALPGVSQALAALAERRRDVFAPPRVPVLLRVDLLVPSGGRMRFVDGAGGALFVAGGRAQENALMTALASGAAIAAFGDVALEGALPVLLPLALVARVSGVLRLLPLGADAVPDDRDRQRWSETAKKGGVSAAATLLGEVRDDLATGFEEGAAVAATSRFLAPLAARLTELKLDKQAAALGAVTGATDPSASLDALVKVHQVLGIALSRLAGTAPLDRATLVTLPTVPSVAIARPTASLAPDAAVAAEARGEIDRFERAFHVGAHYAGMTQRDLVAGVHRYWGDGDAVPFVLEAARAERALAFANARALLRGQKTHAWAPTPARLAMLTAIRVLGATREPRAEEVLRAIDAESHDEALGAFAKRELSGPLVSRHDVEQGAAMVLTASSREHRIAAIRALEASAAIEAIPALRAALRDRAAPVRKAAAYALAALGDTLSLDTFVSWLESDDHDQAKAGAHAVGRLGDVRGGGAILAALSRGFSPSVVREALELLGPWVLSPLLDLSESRPDVAKRASVASLVKTFAREHASETIGAWLAAAEADPDPQRLVRRARLALEVASQRPDVLRPLAAWCAERPHLQGDDKERRALRKKITTALAAK